MSAHSLYIPGVYANISESMIKETFHRMKIGKVNRAILVSQKTNKNNKAYVYFDELYNTTMATTMLDEIKSGSSKLFYARTPHVYWVLLENHRELQADERSPITIGASAPGSADDYEEVPTFTEEEESFVPVEDVSMVSSDYAAQLEHEIAILRNDNAQLQYNAQVMFAHYNQCVAANAYLNAQIMNLSQGAQPMEECDSMEEGEECEAMDVSN